MIFEWLKPFTQSKIFQPTSFFGESNGSGATVRSLSAVYYNITSFMTGSCARQTSITPDPADTKIVPPKNNTP